MAPEQTGRMNRSIDSRTDLYALGITLYRDVHGLAAVHGGRPYRVGPLPHRPEADAADRGANAPGPISAIIMRLLAKTPEERYQTPIGLVHDLRRCLAEWEAQRRSTFPLGLHDRPDRLVIPETLYGREREVEALLGFRRGCGRRPAVGSGFRAPGVGKSAVANELYRTLAPARGMFASGKGDAYQRNVPYAELALALRGLIAPLLGKSDAELRPWRDALREALGQNGQLVSALLPELERLIGPQPPTPELPPRDAQRRFQLVLRRLLGVFARPEHPLALFLDDLQWLDGATLDLLEDLRAQRDLLTSFCRRLSG